MSISDPVTDKSCVSQWPLSFEFYPPKTAQGEKNLPDTWASLARYAPEYFSVTYGAGGSTRDNTRDIALAINAAGHSVAPHISFGGDDEQSVNNLLATYRDAGISRLVALRGDLPTGMSGDAHLVHANELVSLIRENYADYFTVYVASYPEIHPEALSYQQDIHWLREKFKAGANAAITQYFYNIDAYWYFVDQCQQAGIDQAVVPGIMPITNFENLARFSSDCGAEIPRWMCQQLKQYSGDPGSIKQFGIDVVSKLCEQLLDGGAPGLHFYTMNQVEPVASILANIGRVTD